MFELKENVNIKNLIYEVRGKQVMLDSDLAKLYGCANGTKTINLAVKRNIERFPDNFYFQLTREEYDEIRFKYSRFQFETSKIETRGGVENIYLMHLLSKVLQCYLVCLEQKKLQR